MKRAALLAIVSSATPALADPGHGMSGSLVHLLTEPDHLAVLALAAAAAIYGFRRLRSRRQAD